MAFSLLPFSLCLSIRNCIRAAAVGVIISGLRFLMGFRFDRCCLGIVEEEGSGSNGTS